MVLGDTSLQGIKLEGDVVRVLQNNQVVAATGLYCGTTSTQAGNLIGGRIEATTASGLIVGYEAAAIKCKAVPECGPNPHMCTGNELAISLQYGLAPSTTAWYSTASAGFNRTVDNVSNPNVITNDCRGWTSTAPGTSLAGPILNMGASEPFPDHAGCDSLLPIACCK